MGIEDEIAAPRLYYKKDGAIKDIAFYSKMTAEDAVGYLRYGSQSDPSTDAVEDCYIPYVPTTHPKASDIRVKVGGSEYSLLRQGYLVGTERTVYAWANPPTTNMIFGSAVVSKYRLNEESPDGYNVSVRVKGKYAMITFAAVMSSGNFRACPHWINNYPEGYIYLNKMHQWYASVPGKWAWEDPDDITYTGRFDGPIVFSGWKNPLYMGLSGLEIKVWE